MTKDEALEKYKKRLTDFDYMGVNAQWLERINTDKLTAFAVSAIVRDFYELEERIEQYKETVNQLVIKNHKAIKVLDLWNETGDVDRIQDEQLEVLKEIDSTIS